MHGGGVPRVAVGAGHAEPDLGREVRQRQRQQPPRTREFPCRDRDARPTGRADEPRRRDAPLPRLRSRFPRAPLRRATRRRPDSATGRACGRGTSRRPGRRPPRPSGPSRRSRATWRSRLRRLLDSARSHVALEGRNVERPEHDLRAGHLLGPRTGEDDVGALPERGEVDRPDRRRRMADDGRAEPLLQRGSQLLAERGSAGAGPARYDQRHPMFRHWFLRRRRPVPARPRVPRARRPSATLRRGPEEGRTARR